MYYRRFLIASALPALVATTAVATYDDYKPRFDAGFQALRRAEYDRAIAEFDAVIRINSDVPSAYLNRGFCYHKKGKRALALADYTRCIEKCGTHAQFRSIKARALTNRGDAYWQLADWDKALGDADTAVVVDPAFAYAYRLRSCLFYARGDYARAVAEYEQARRLLPDIAPLTLTPEGAEANARKNAIGTAAPADASALIAGGRASLERLVPGGDTHACDAAIADLDRALMLDPRSAVAWYLRARLEEVAAPGDRARALPFYDRAIDADPRFVEAYRYRGRVRWEARGDFDGAIRDLSEALALAPDDLEGYRLRAGAYEAARNWRKALADRNRVIERDPSPAAYAARADVLSELGWWESALADYDRSLDLDPRQDAVRKNREAALRKKGS